MKLLILAAGFCVFASAVWAQTPTPTADSASVVTECLVRDPAIVADFRVDTSSDEVHSLLKVDGVKIQPLKNSCSLMENKYICAHEKNDVVTYTLLPIVDPSTFVVLSANFIAWSAGASAPPRPMDSCQKL
jgi:hypothetical protein